MEGFLQAAGSVGVWTGAVLWAALLAVSCFAILLSLPGGWIALGLAILYDALHGFSSIGWVRLAVFAALLGVGEAVEALLGSVYVAKKGASRWGIVGGFVGGIGGSIAGTPVMPIVGTLAGGFLGAFAGAVTGEYLRERRLESSVQVGFHATVGKFLAVLTKGLLALVGATVVATEAFRELAR